MQTLTVTKARQNLGGWLKKAVAGEEVGVVVGDTIVAFRPVRVVAADYAEREYGLTAAEVEAAVARIIAATRTAAASGETVEYKPGMLTRENRTDQAVSRRGAKTRR
jgi:antitoxin (DNA-binding transcriptional repressor) of toxin-antitoxin stability system